MKNINVPAPAAKFLVIDVDFELDRSGNAYGAYEEVVGVYDNLNEAMEGLKVSINRGGSSRNYVKEMHNPMLINGEFFKPKSKVHFLPKEAPKKPAAKKAPRKSA